MTNWHTLNINIYEKSSYRILLMTNWHTLNNNNICNDPDFINSDMDHPYIIIENKDITEE